MISEDDIFAKIKVSKKVLSGKQGKEALLGFLIEGGEAVFKEMRKRKWVKKKKKTTKK